MRFLSNLELAGQGHGIIMGVTRLLLLGPFYYIALYWVVQNYETHCTLWQVQWPALALKIS